MDPLTYAHQVAAAIITRSPTILALPEWIAVPWSTESDSKDIMQHLLDRMVEIPALLARFDQLKDFSLSGTQSPEQIALWQRELVDLRTGIERGLHLWKSEWADTYPSGHAREAPAQETTSPTFRCHDPTAGEIVRPTVFVYPDPVLGQAMCHYYAALILVFSAVDLPPEKTVRNPRIYYLACLICRSMDYYLQQIPGFLTSRVAFPFRVAYDGLLEGSIERNYVEQVFSLIAERRLSREWEGFLRCVSVPQSCS